MGLKYYFIIKPNNSNVKCFFLQFNTEFDYLFWKRTTINRGDKIIKSTKLKTICKQI